MKILVSNDDGIDAPGIRALAGAMTHLGDTFVIAPDRNRSGASNSLTLSQPVRCKTRAEGWVSVEGTPSDCVLLGLRHILSEVPDLVVSGINDSENMGDDVFYSGTVAAAIEGRFLGLPSIAISLAYQDGDPNHFFDTAAEVAKNLVVRLSEKPLPHRTILNVNVPNRPYSELKGFEITRLGLRHPSAHIERRVDPRGGEYYWIGNAGEENDGGQGTDFHAIAMGAVSVTPLLLDLSHYSLFSSLSDWLQGTDKG